MFVPGIYRTVDHELLSGVIRDHPLAVMVSNGPQVPLATHLPVVPESAVPSQTGATLLGHMNRANPHWKALRDGDSVRLIFGGPQGYVSPVVYPPGPAAPTWNFVSVHVQGTLELLPGVDHTLEVVGRTIERFEQDFGVGWDPADSHEYHRGIGPGVGAFRVTVTAVDGQFKLSQDKPAEQRARILEWFATSSRGNGRDLARYMCENEERHHD